MILINQQEVINAIEKCHKRCCRNLNGDEWIHYETTLNEVEALPTIQSKRGKWIKISPANIYECSKCGKHVMTNDISAYDFCHGCGADMRGEANGQE